MRTVKWVMFVVLVGAIGCGCHTVEADANYRRGEQYLNGDGVTKDEIEALNWFRKAAEQGHATAQLALGLSYMSGHGVPKDEVEAAKWFHRAAEQGDLAAPSALAFMYENGRGVTEDKVEAAKWRRKASERGNVVEKDALEAILLGHPGTIRPPSDATTQPRSK